MEIKINVKEEHIINGECHNVSGCAIALAVRDIFKGALIFYESILITGAGSGNIITNNRHMPEDAQNNMHTFDHFDAEKIIGKARLEHLKPFSFVVDVDESLLFPDKLLEEIEQIIQGSKNVELVIV